MTGISQARIVEDALVEFFGQTMQQKYQETAARLAQRKSITLTRLRSSPAPPSMQSGSGSSGSTKLNRNYSSHRVKGVQNLGRINRSSKHVRSNRLGKLSNRKPVPDSSTADEGHGESGDDGG